MTTTSDLTIEEVAELGRRMKRERVVKYGNDPNPQESDLRPFVVCVRDGRQVAWVTAGEGQVATRTCVYWGAALMRCELVYVVADARFKYLPKDAGFDEDAFQPGDFQREWEAGNREGLTEALAITRLPAMGPATMLSYPYEREGTKLTWLTDAMPPGQPSAMRGALLDQARRGFLDARKLTSDPEFLELMDLIGGLSSDECEEHRSFHFDRAAGRFISGQDQVGRVIVGNPPSIFIGGDEMEVDLDA